MAKLEEVNMSVEGQFKGDTLPVTFSHDQVKNYPELVVVLNSLSERMTSAGISKTKEKDIINLTSTIKQLYFQYLKSGQFLTYVKHTVFDSNNKSSLLAEEIGNLMLTEELSHYSPVSCDKSSRVNLDKTFFGLSVNCGDSNGSTVLNYSDASRRSWEDGDKSMENKSQIFQDHAALVPVPEICHGKLNLLSYNAELHKSMRRYKEVLGIYLNLLEDGIAVMHTFKKDIELNFGDLILKKINLSKANAEILKCQMLLSFFAEDENVVEALRKISSMTKSNICTVKNKILELIARQRAYEKLMDSKFQDVLKEYQEVLDSISQKNWMIRCFVDGSNHN